MRLTLSLIFLFLSGCREGYDKNEVREEMKNLMLSYKSAIESMDVEGTIRHFSEDPEFYFHSDGINYTLDEMKVLVKTKFFTGLKKVEVRYDSMHISALSSEHAVCFTKLEEILTDSADNVIRLGVDATFVGSHADGQWKIIYGHATHRLISEREKTN